MNHKKALIVGIGGALALLGSCGGETDDVRAAGDGGRRVEVAMVDVAFEPATIEVEKGEAVRFVFTNRGKTRHEAFIGTRAEQLEHEKAMAEGGAGGGGHDAHGGSSGDGNKLTLEPGDRGELTHRFDDTGTFEIGCHEPGHYAGGMKVTVTVT